MIAVRFCLVISKCPAGLISFRSAYRWASQETLMTLQTFRLGFFQPSPTTQSHALCSMLSLRWAHKGIQLLFVRLDMPSLRSRPVFKWLHLSFRWIWNGSFAKHWCWFMHVPVVWVLVILSIQLSCNHAARCGLPKRKVVSQMSGSQTYLFSRFERKREKYEAMINEVKSNYVEQILLRSSAIMLHDITS